MKKSCKNMSDVFDRRRNYFAHHLDFPHYKVKGPNFVPAPNLAPLHFSIPIVAFSVSFGSKCCISIRQYSERLRVIG